MQLIAYKPIFNHLIRGLRGRYCLSSLIEKPAALLSINTALKSQQRPSSPVFLLFPSEHLS